MDKSLKFFLGIEQPPQSKDEKTGFSTKKVEGEVRINYFSATDPTQIVNSETKKYSFNAVESGQTNGQYINYLGNSATNDIAPFLSNPEHDSDIKPSDIITWTQKNYPRMELKPQHLAYLKDFNRYPANRFIILRRFSGAAPHNLFKSKSKVKPISTMVGYYDFENIPVKISFNEKWKQFDSTFLSVIQDVIGIKFDSIPGVGEIFSKAATSPLGQDLMYLIGKKLGFISGGSMPYGDPNLIHDAAIRDVSGEALSTGLESDISIDFETTYIANDIPGGPDGKAAMLDIIANGTRMGTSDGRFLSGNSAALKDIFKNFEQGDISGLTNAFKEALDETIAMIKDAVTLSPEQKKAMENKSAKDKVQDYAMNVINGIAELGAEIVKQRFSRYRWKIKGAIAAMTGSHTAPWHITIGNPKFPWFVCGNLVLESCEVEQGGELTYDDMPSEITFKIKLRSGRTMHGGEITSLFNAGRGRIYDTPDKLLTYNVVEGTQIIIPNDGSGTQTAPPSKNDVTNAQSAPEDLNKLPEGTSSTFSNTNQPGNEGLTI